jgi:ParB family chromosome partitioning protein
MVTKKPKGLGLGLEALLGPKVDAGAADEAAPTQLPLSQLRAGKYQPRTRMDEGALYELAESIKSQGLMQPILVRPVSGGSTPYEIIAGERRFRAAQIAGLETVPVLVKPVPDEAAAVMALIENIQREDLNPLEEAQGLQRLVAEFGLTHEQAAQAVGRSRSAASNLLRLLNLAEAVQQLLLAGDLDMGHARALLPLPAAEQVMAAQEIVARKLSVRDAERLASRKASEAADHAAHAGDAGHPGNRPARQAAGKARDILRLEQQLADLLAAAVDIRIKKRGRRGEQGEVAIAFGSLEELNGLLERLGLREP